MTLPNVAKKCLKTPPWGSVSCLPPPNTFPLAKEKFSKGKCFGMDDIFIKFSFFFMLKYTILCYNKFDSVRSAYE